MAGCEVTTGGGAWLTGALGRRVIVDGGGGCAGLEAGAALGATYKHKSTVRNSYQTK